MKTTQPSKDTKPNARIIELESEVKHLKEINLADLEAHAATRNAHAKELEAARARIRELRDGLQRWFNLCQRVRGAYLVKFAVEEEPQNTDAEAALMAKEIINRRLALHALVNAAPFDDRIEPQDIDGDRHRHAFGECSPGMAFSPLREEKSQYHFGSVLYGTETA